MAADNYLSGLTGAVLLGGQPYSFGKWKLAMETKMIVRNNFTVQGFQRIIGGFTKGTITVSGPYNQGNMPLACGSFPTWTLQWTQSIGIVLVAGIQNLDPDNDAEDAPNVSVTALSNGVFVASIT